MTGQRVAPHDMQAEEALLGAVLLSRDAIVAAAEVVRPADFYKPAHVAIFDAVLNLYGSGEPVDPVTVADELSRVGMLDMAGGYAGLVMLQGDAPAISNAGRYGRIVEELAVLRRMIGAAGEIAELGYSLPDDVDKALDVAERTVFELAERRDRSEVTGIRAALENALNVLEERYEHGSRITGTPTGYLDFDELLSGLQPGALTVVGARPAMGKTAFALGMAAHAALAAERPVLFFSLEMSQLEITQRLLASECRIDATRFKNGKLDDRDWEKLGNSVGRLADAPLWLDDNPNVSVTEIRSKARKMKAQFGGLGMVVVDYVQLMAGGDAENETLRIGAISRGLKLLAREIDTPVVVLAQLNRGLEQRADKRPQLSDLRQSGSLEQDADVVVFLYRDDAYHQDSVDRGMCEVIVAKHRTGPTGLVRLAWMPQYTKFANMARA